MHQFICIYCYVNKSNYSVPALNFVVMFGMYIEQHRVWPITHFNIGLWKFVDIKYRISQLKKTNTKKISKTSVDLLTLQLIVKGTVSQLLFWIHFVLVRIKVYNHGYVKSSPVKILPLVSLYLYKDIYSPTYATTKNWVTITSYWYVDTTSNCQSWH